MSKKNTSTTVVSTAHEQPVLALREQDAAAALGVSVRTLRRWRETPRKGPRFSRVGRTVLYPVTEIQKFLDKNLCR